jgi:hypothetical protein
LEFGEQFTEGVGGLCGLDPGERMRDGLDELLEARVMGVGGWRGIEEEEAGGVGGVLGGEGDECEGEEREGGVVVLADDEQVVAALALEWGFGGAFDGIGCAEPDTGHGGGLEG